MFSHIYKEYYTYKQVFCQIQIIKSGQELKILTFYIYSYSNFNEIIISGKDMIAAIAISYGRHSKKESGLNL